jgi:hypothetical protein
MVPFLTLAYHDPFGPLESGSFEDHMFQWNNVLVVTLACLTPDAFNSPLGRVEGSVSQIVVRVRKGVYHEAVIVSRKVTVCPPHCRAICVLIKVDDDLTSILLAETLHYARPVTQEFCRLGSGQAA